MRQTECRERRPVILRPERLVMPDGIRIGVSTRIGGVSPEPLGMNLSMSVGDDPRNVDENRKRFCAAAGVRVESLVFQGQVHGDAIHRVFSPGRIPSCDALVTDIEGLFLAVSIADCVPILLADPVKRVVAGVHSGWRGSVRRILSMTVDRLQNEFDVRPHDLVAYIGPSASVCCYEVGEDVAAQFEKSFVKRSDGLKPRLDLKEVNRSLLRSSGVRDENIEVSRHCTICNPELFHSYRRDKERSGRMLAVIGITERGIDETS